MTLYTLGQTRKIDLGQPFAPMLHSNAPLRPTATTLLSKSLYKDGLKQGDCSSNRAAVYGRYPPPESERDEEGEARALRLCRFAHPWVPDNVSLDSVPVTFGAATWPFVRAVLVWAVGEGWARMVVPAIVVVLCVVVGRRCLRRLGEAGGR